MHTTQPKPKLVFFQYKYDENLPEFLLIQKREHVKCLSEFFDVAVINKDCDYVRTCEEQEPDLTLFETGPNIRTCRRPEVTNTHACPTIPKLGFINADAWCETRPATLSEMDHLGIETFFAISTTAAEHAPEIADRLFIWPNFVDGEVYRDYGESKLIPVLLTGSKDPQYPWRRRIYKLIGEYYPSLTCPHHGYGGRSPAGQAMYGERYARTINASLVVPTCGTVAKEVVRKHFEVPACKACLITERSAGLEAAGFIDMKNCVFADEGDVLDKLAYLFEHPEELRAITNAGYELIHSRHTLKHRDQILRWFTLYKNLKESEMIVQSGPFASLTVVEKSSGVKNSHVFSNGLHLRLLSEGDEKLLAGKYIQAEYLYRQCLSYLPRMPEPKLGLALCELHMGNAKRAHDWICEPIQYTLADYKAIDPDPVEWAYFIICLLCLGKLEAALKRGNEFAWLRHPELDRARWVTRVLTSPQRAAPLVQDEGLKHRFTIHRLLGLSLEDWVRHVCAILRACRRHDLAETLAKCSSKEGPSFQAKEDRAGAKRETLTGENGRLKRSCTRAGPFGWARKGVFGFLRRRQISARARRALKGAVKCVLYRLESKYGYFLPYRLSRSRNDDFFGAIQELAREKDIKTLLIIGAAHGEPSTEALLAGAEQNNNMPTTICIRTSKPRLVRLERVLANGHLATWYTLSSSSFEGPENEFGETVKKVKRDNHIEFFDVLLIDGSELGNRLSICDDVVEELRAARYILLDDVSRAPNQEINRRLLTDPRFILLNYNPALRDGYAIFEKIAYQSEDLPIPNVIGF